MDFTKELPAVLSLCSGYGGIERGLDLAGFKHRVIAFSEIEAFAIANLVAKMEANLLSPAPVYTNLKTLPAHLFRDRVDLITGGYPCQPFSAAGKRLGEDDPRHLWPYIRGHIESIRPVRCFFENVEGHISLGLREVIADLESLGYLTTWGIFSAREVGAPHQRKRVYILADSSGKGLQRCGITRNISGKESQPDDQFAPRCNSAQIGEWEPEPNFCRVVDGIADRVDRIRMLGNGIVPQTAAKAWSVLSKRMEITQ